MQILQKFIVKMTKEEKLIASNPAEGIKLPRIEKKEPRILTPVEKENFINTLSGE